VVPVAGPLDARAEPALQRFTVQHSIGARRHLGGRVVLVAGAHDARAEPALQRFTMEYSFAISGAAWCRWPGPTTRPRGRRPSLLVLC
jgi:hypothetical protein